MSVVLNIEKGLAAFWACLLILSTSSLESKADDPEPRRSDGTIFKSTFENQKEVAGWEEHGNGAYSVENGELVFEQSDGDNAVDTPGHEVGKSDEYVLQADFRVPEKAEIKPPFMIIGLLTDEGGGLSWRTNFRLYTDLGDQYTVGVQDPQQTEFEPKLDKGKTYTVAIHVTPKDEAHYFLFADDRDPGTFLGTISLTSNHSHRIRIGNVFGAGSGEQVIDNVLLGKPTKAILSVSFASKLSTTWGASKIRR
jgi:hypothetical protein